MADGDLCKSKDDAYKAVASSEKMSQSSDSGERNMESKVATVPASMDKNVESSSKQSERVSKVENIDYGNKDTAVKESSAVCVIAHDESEPTDFAEKPESIPSDKLPEDKSSRDSRWSVGKGLGVLVKKFRNLGSPKKVDTSDVEGLELFPDSIASTPRFKDKKCQTPINMAVSFTGNRDDYTSAEDDIESLTADEIGMAKTSDKKPTSSEMPRKKSPLRNIIKRCKTLMKSPKKASDDVIVTCASHETQTEEIKLEQTEECTESSPTSLPVSSFAPDTDSKAYEKNLPISALDKRKEFKALKHVAAEITSPDLVPPGGVLSTVEYINPSVIRSSISLPIPDTSCSAALSDSEMSSITGSSSYTSSELIFAKDSKTKKLDRYDTVIENPEWTNLSRSKNLEVKEEEETEELDVTESSKAKTFTRFDTVIENPKWDLLKLTQSENSQYIKEKEMEKFVFTAKLETPDRLGIFPKVSKSYSPKKSHIRKFQVKMVEEDESDKMEIEAVESNSPTKRDVIRSPRKRTPPLQRQKRFELNSPEDPNQIPKASGVSRSGKLSTAEQSPLKSLASVKRSSDVLHSSDTDESKLPYKMLTSDTAMSESSEPDVMDVKYRIDVDDKSSESPTKRPNQS